MSYTVFTLVEEIRRHSEKLLTSIQDGVEFQMVEELVDKINEAVETIIQITDVKDIGELSKGFARHLYWLNRRTSERRPEESEGDVNDFLNRDLDDLLSGLASFYGIVQRGKIVDLTFHGKGSFAKIYKGFDPETGSKIAIKEMFSSSVFKEFYGQDGEEFASRFKREVGLMRKFSHPNIIPILETQLERKPYWFHMPLADCSLPEWLEKNPDASIEQRLSIFLQILNAVEYLHDNRFVHRDLAPWNILLHQTTETLPKVWVADYGLAKDMKKNSNSSFQTLGTRKNWGHDGYTAREQLEDLKNATQLSDIYSIGGLLYSILTGRSPDKRFEYIADCDGIIKMAMHEKSQMRYQSIESLRYELVMHYADAIEGTDLEELLSPLYYFDEDDDLLEDLIRERMESEAGIDILHEDQIITLFDELLSEFFIDLTNELEDRLDLRIDTIGLQRGKREIFSVRSEFSESVVKIIAETEINDDRGSDSTVYLSVYTNNELSETYHIKYTNGDASILDGETYYYPTTQNDTDIDALKDIHGIFLECVNDEFPNPESKIEFLIKKGIKPVADFECSECGFEGISVNENLCKIGTCVYCGVSHEIDKCEQCGTIIDLTFDGTNISDDVIWCNNCLEHWEEQ